MSRGPGRIERAIHDLMAAEPDGAWTPEDLAERIYVGIVNRIEKKHRVSVQRAVRNVIRDDPDWDLWRGYRVGNPTILYNRASVRSYGLMRLKDEGVGYYYRKPPSRMYRYYVSDEDMLLAELDNDRHRELMAPGGSWWRHVQQHIAERDGDADRAWIVRGFRSGGA